MNALNILPKEKKVEIAMQMVICDAIEKGHTDKNEMMAYMQSDAFEKQVRMYLDMMA